MSLNPAFKGRYLMERDSPLCSLKEMLSLWVLGQLTSTRGEYRHLIDLMDVAIDEARAAGIVGFILGTDFFVRCFMTTERRRVWRDSIA